MKTGYRSGLYTYHRRTERGFGCRSCTRVRERSRDEEPVITVKHINVSDKEDENMVYDVPPEYMQLRVLSHPQFLVGSLGPCVILLAVDVVERKSAKGWKWMERNAKLIGFGVLC